MRTNLPITQCDYDYPDDAIIVSTTDAQGRITHCNRSFVEISGFDYEELLGQPHNLVRHPDMPPEAFKDMWTTVGRGRPWTGIVKNRRKNGDHYWVKANVTPIMEGGRPVAYMSVRFKPTAAEVQDAQALYARIAAERESGHPTIRLHAGRVRLTGWRDLPGRLHRLSLSQRMAIGLATVLLSTMAVIRLWPSAGAFVHAVVAAAAAGAVLLWFRHSVQSRLDEAERFATDLASCNLSTRLDTPHPHPLSQLARALTQIQINLRAVVGDAREEVTGTLAALTQIAAGSRDLATRTDAQAAALQQTAASMEQFAQTVRHTAEHAAHVARESHQTAATAADGGRAIDEVTHTVHAIQASSRQMADIVQVIESIAFQTNVLAINAAVEAARAGDEGRGFAVVATEVRALAQRSARSAKEIRQLIHDSVRQVADGTQRMDAAGATIGRTVEAVQRVGQMIEQITQATSEQSGGIAQVNSAVGELDRVTQANALLVQQTADITHALSKRAEALKRSVQVYRD